MNSFDQLLIEILGKKLQSQSFQEFLKKVGEVPFINNEFEDVFYYEFKEKGISCLFNKFDSTLEAIHLFGENDEEYEIYSEQLPHQLSFENSREEVIRKLGTPSIEGGGEKDILGEIIPPWIKYLYPNYQLHVEFNERNQLVTMITLMIPDSL